MSIRLPITLTRDLASWGGESAREWISSLPALVESIASAWELELEDPFDPGGAVSWTAPARTRDGEDVVLKVAWPHDEARDEALGLRVWDGHGTVRLLRHDASSWAMLLERLVPGTRLAREWSDSTVDVGVSVLQQLWSVAPGDAPFDRLETQLAGWADTAEERAGRVRVGVDAGIVSEGIALLRSLPRREESFLLHQDLHPENVLSSSRGWLAIDPKPVVGDRGFDVTALVAHTIVDGAHLRERLARLEDALGIERDHLRRWALARTIMWLLWAADVGDDRDWRAELARMAVLLASPG